MTLRWFPVWLVCDEATCHVTCGAETGSRVRSCDNHPPANKGAICTEFYKYVSKSHVLIYVRKQHFCVCCRGRINWWHPANWGDNHKKVHIVTIFKKINASYIPFLLYIFLFRCSDLANPSQRAVYATIPTHFVIIFVNKCFLCFLNTYLIVLCRLCSGLEPDHDPMSSTVPTHAGHRTSGHTWTIRWI